MHRLLLVDDEPANLQLLQLMLGPLPVAIRTAGGGRAALEALERESFDLVLLDLHMPELDGADVLTHLRATHPWLPVIVITASSERADRLRGLDAGADEFLEKPIDRAVLLARVKTLLRLRDLTTELAEKKERLEALLRRERELSQFIAHDMRNPLAVLETNLRYATAGAGLPAGVGDALDDAREAVRHMLMLIESLTVVSKLEDGALPLQPKDLSLAEMLDTVYRAHRRQAELHGVVLEAVAEGEVRVIADEPLLRRTLENLVDNALRYTPQGGRIRLTASAEATGAQVRVSNTGTPIPEEKRALLFQKFARLDPKAPRSGRGLGLYFCRRVLEAHGGSIRVEATPEWPTEFQLLLPVRPEAR